MSDSVQCPHCQKTYRITPALAGKRVKCRACSGVIPIPNLPTASPAATPTPAAKAPLPRAAAPAKPKPAPATQARPQKAASVRDDIENGFSGPIPRVRASFAYRAAQLVVAFVMILLPIAYIGVICGVCFLVYLHATHSHVIMHGVRGRATLIAASIYIGPIVAGVIQILFMLKPFIAPPGRDERVRSITPQGEPHVFALVKRIAEAVGSPLPKKIDVDCDLNAAAAYQRGVWSIFLGSDLKLVIGMPLAAGLSLQQFAGVLAHEFGHFSQGAGMRLSYLIRMINYWFARAVYERDGWDEWLVEHSAGLDWRIGWMLYLAQFSVFLTRRILWVFMVLGAAVSGILMRQMEYNADLFETRLVGSETFAATTRRIHELGAAWQLTQRDVMQFLRQKQMPDNLAKFMLHNSRKMPPDVAFKVRKAFDEERTGLFDSHPCGRDRIAASAEEAAPGVFRSQRPASDLFVYFDSLCKNVSWDLYSSIYGPSLPPSAMHSTDELLRFVQDRPAQAETPVQPTAYDTESPIPLAGD